MCKTKEDAPRVRGRRKEENKGKTKMVRKDVLPNQRVDVTRKKKTPKRQGGTLA